MLRKFNVNINGKDYVVKLEEIGAPENTAITAVQPTAPIAPAAPSVAPVESAPQPVVVGDGLVVDTPMPGNILKILVNVGDKVVENQGLFILEAMKMENEIVAPKSGTVAAIHTKEGTTIDVGKPVITIV